jgi:hypothetical protein
MEAIGSNGSNSATSFKELTLGLAEQSLERILELSEATQISRREVAKDMRTETIVHTTLWLENFTIFLEQLSTVA